MTMKMQMVVEVKIHHLLMSTVQKSNQKDTGGVQLLLMQMEVVVKMIQK